MTLATCRRWLQPLLFTGLFCCWLLLGVLGVMWLQVAERRMAQQALDQQLQQQLAVMHRQLDALQSSTSELLQRLGTVRRQDAAQLQPALDNYRRQQPLLSQLALLTLSAQPHTQLTVLTFAPFQLGGRLLPGQDLARQTAVASAMQALQQGQAQLLRWQPAQTEQWLWLLPGSHGMVLAIWLQPQQLLAATTTQGSVSVSLWQPEGGRMSPPWLLSSQQVLHSGVFRLQITATQPWLLADRLGWRLLVLTMFMLLLWWLGCYAWQHGRRLLAAIAQGRAMQQQWLAQAGALAPVSVHTALATLERQLPGLAPGQRLLVWWVHGRGARRRQFHLETVMLRLEGQLLRQPFGGMQSLRLRHGGLLLSLTMDEAEVSELLPRVSHWLNTTLGGRADEAALLWLSFDVSHGVQTLEVAMTEPGLQVPDMPHLPAMVR